MSNRLILSKQMDSLLWNIEQLLQSANSGEQLTSLAILISVSDNIGWIEKVLREKGNAPL